MDKIRKIFNTQKNIPIWLMRQAGRYLPEYKEVRKTIPNFLDLCYDPQKAAIVTLQPITRFGFDAAIIFSDILVLPDALGWDVRFEEKVGPILRKFTSSEDFNYLTEINNNDKLSKVYEAIQRVKEKLPAYIPLIGFTGAPWTVVSYMLAGRSKHDFHEVKKFIYQNKSLVKTLIDFITEQTSIHLIGQIESGADIVQLFDSWAGMLSEQEYEEFVIEPTKKIVKIIKEKYPNIPIIGFPKGSGYLYEKYINSTEIDCIGVDQFVPIDIMKQWQDRNKIAVQGNLDPVILLTSKEVIKEKLDNILNTLLPENFIFNLGHGILPETPIENVEFLVNYVRNFKR